MLVKHLQNEIKTRWGDSKNEIGFDVHHVYEQNDIKRRSKRDHSWWKSAKTQETRLKRGGGDSVNLLYLDHRTNKSCRSYVCSKGDKPWKNPPWQLALSSFFRRKKSWWRSWTSWRLSHDMRDLRFGLETTNWNLGCPPFPVSLLQMKESIGIPCKNPMKSWWWRASNLGRVVQKTPRKNYPPWN